MAFGIFGKKKDEKSEGTPAGAGAGAPPTATGGGEDFSPDAGKARKFFDRAQTVQDTGNHEYAVTLWLQGLRMDPSSVEGLEGFAKAAAQFAQTSKAKGPSKDQASAFAGKSNIDRYLAALLVWGVKPMDWQQGAKALEAAAKLNLGEAGYWIGTRVLGVAGQDPKVKKDQLVQIMGLLQQIGAHDKAVIAGELASKLDPSDGKLIAEVRNMAAQATMNKGGYEQSGQAGGFRSNVRDLQAQRARSDEEQIVKTEETAARVIEAAKADYDKRPTDPGAIQKLARLLRERGTPEDEKLAYQVLMKGYEATQSYRFKEQAGDLKIRVGRRKLAELRAEVERDPANAAKKEQYAKAERQLLEAEVKEFEERAAAYPTDLAIKAETGRRWLDLGDPEKAIEYLQQARGAPQVGQQVLLWLAQAFWKLTWLDEAEATYREALTKQNDSSDDLGVELRYGLLSVLERQAGERRDVALAEEAFKLASGIAVQRINYKDIRARRQALQELVKQLREGTR